MFAGHFTNDVLVKVAARTEMTAPVASLAKQCKDDWCKHADHCDDAERHIKVRCDDVSEKNEVAIFLIKFFKHEISFLSVVKIAALWQRMKPLYKKEMSGSVSLSRSAFLWVKQADKQTDYSYICGEEQELI